ncbi:TIGR03899 family protein [Pseudoalteromonas xiamenensis]|uniref:TIGR03899 family protein n=1 Tax=Pseudoalteromonas xiamenensis TaxID=882626 RepID=UPI0027E53C67|nr:TIGR03899 family protein [Pseudoalteromonas xiamenensis]WMN58386.1 TIGR03899 family protein [Pseudoalteromonas xiamenensis]
MTVKNAQAKLSLAYIIEDKLGFPVIKADSRRLSSADENSYTVGGKQGENFAIKSNVGLLKRALKRNQLTKIQRQKNIEAIMCEAMRVCPEVTSQGLPDADWVDRFIHLAEDTSNTQMQLLWAKILVGETISPGTFSIKSLQTLKQMTQREADALHRAAGLCGYSEKDDSHIIILGFYRKPSFFDLLRKSNRESLNLSKAGLSFPHILTLMDIGLIYRQEIESAELKSDQALQFRFQRQKLALSAKHSDLVLCYYKLTQTGDELKKLINSPINKLYKQALQQAFEEDFQLQWSE